ncbi:Cytoplasmic polyadenylation element binding protein 2 [Cichlidogyrus casuarinus]|uniref:Cytoplasmic polyadenylation element binding protein 2 n=1 Tax=Cichlidogyrus casuarinus TaxID=1844966 RepID=A0ABD2QC34_9PLAT
MSASEVDVVPNQTESKNLFSNQKPNFNDNDKGFVDDTKSQPNELFGQNLAQMPNNFSQCSSATPSVSLDGTNSNSDLGIGRVTSLDSGSLVSPSSSQISPGPNASNVHASGLASFQSQEQSSNISDNNMLLMRQRMMDILNPSNNFGVDHSDNQIPDAFNEHSDLSNLGLLDLPSSVSENVFNLPNSRPLDSNLLGKQMPLDQDSYPYWNQQSANFNSFEEINTLQSMFNAGNVSPILSSMGNGSLPNNSQILQSVASMTSSKRPITGGHQTDSRLQNRPPWSGNMPMGQTKPTCSSPSPFNNWGNNQAKLNAMMMNGARGQNSQSSMNRQGLLIGTDNSNMSNSSPSSSPLGSAGSKSLSSTMSGSQSGNQANIYNMFPKRAHHRMMPYMNKQGNKGIMDPSGVDGSSMFGGANPMSSNEQQAMMEMMKSFDGMGLNSRTDPSGPNSMGLGGRPIVSNSSGGLLDDQNQGPSLFSSLDHHAGNNFQGNSNSNGDFMNLTSAIPPKEEGFSRKVFVGGLPPDIDEEEITTAFCRFGSLIVDWPHKTESKAYFPPKGYCFLLFMEERSVQNLINACIVDEGKYYWCVSSPTMKDKPVQIRPWNLADSDFVFDACQPLDPRKTIFVGGVPRPLKAVELALIMNRLYGGVCYAGIDTDPELKYPKGAGRVAFSNQQSYIAAISARFVQLQHSDIEKRVEVKPYVLDNQMCDECQGARCGGKFAPFFCANVTCLQYYCDQCWVTIHSRHGREYHKPLVKEGADRPRPAMCRW